MVEYRCGFRWLHDEFVGTREWQHTVFACRGDSDDATNPIGIGEVTTTGRDRRLEAAVLAGSVVEGLDGHGHARLDEVDEFVLFGQRRTRQRVLVAEETGEGVPVGEPDERTDPRGLQARGIRDGEIDAGAESLVEHLCRGPDLLPGALERRGRIDVPDVGAVQRLVDGRGDHRGTFRSALIATERGVTGGVLQDPRGGVEDGGDGTGVDELKAASES